MAYENKHKYLIHWILIASILAIAIVGYGILNVNSKFKSVYVAKKFIPEGTQITEKNFLEYIDAVLIPVKTYSEASNIFNSELFEAETPDSKKQLIGKVIKYNREPGYFITKKTVEIDMINDPIKYKLFKVYQDTGCVFVGKGIKLPPEDYIITKGIGKQGDAVWAGFIKEDKVTGGKKLIWKYKNIPIMDLAIQGTNITDINLAIPEELHLDFEMDSLSAEKTIITFNPTKYEELKAVSKDVYTSSEIAVEDAAGETYDVRDYMKKNITKERVLPAQNKEE